MHRFGLRLSLASALAAVTAGLMLSAASAAAPSSTRTIGVRSTSRLIAPVLPQRPVSSSRTRRTEFFGRLSAAPVVPAPPVPQSPARTRTLPGPAAPFTPAPDAFQVSQQQILINQDRASNGGLPALAWSPCLANVALQNAQRIAAQGYLSHTNGPNLDLACDPSYTSGGENIAYILSGINDVQVNTMFMNSAPHRANILGTGYRFVGTARVVASNGYAYIAVEFAG